MFWSAIRSISLVGKQNTLTGHSCPADCPIGKGCRNGGSCDVCPRGTFKNTTEGIECLPCRAGSSSSNDGSMCHACVSPHVSPRGSGSCGISCPLGFNRDGQECIDGPIGAWTILANGAWAVNGTNDWSPWNGSRTVCQAGKYFNTTSQTCANCSQEQASMAGALSCGSTCPPGAGRSGTSCRNCAPGLWTMQGSNWFVNGTMANSSHCPPPHST